MNVNVGMRCLLKVWPANSRLVVAVEADVVVVVLVDQRSRQEFELLELESLCSGMDSRGWDNKGNLRIPPP